MSDSLFHLGRHDGSPRTRLTQLLQDQCLESTDRIAQELSVRVETSQTAGSYDQLALGEVTVPEIVGRVEQLVTEAYTNRQKPTWDTSELYPGIGGAGDAANTDMRQMTRFTGRTGVRVKKLCV